VPSSTLAAQAQSGCFRRRGYIRAAPLPIIDLNKATGRPGLTDLSTAFVTSLYNYRVLGFSRFARSERIVNMNWSDINIPPPRGQAANHYLTARDHRVDEAVGRGSLTSRSSGPRCTHRGKRPYRGPVKIDQQTHTEAHGRRVADRLMTLSVAAQTGGAFVFRKWR